MEPSLTEGESLDATTLQARRGDILGAADEPLVTRRPVVRFGIDKTKVPAARAVASARALAELLDIDPAAYAKLVKAAGPKAFIEALVLRESDAGSVGRARAQGRSRGPSRSAARCRWRPPGSSRPRSSVGSVRPRPRS